MISFVLEDNNTGTDIAIAQLPIDILPIKAEDPLMPELSTVDEFSYSTFSSDDMRSIKSELQIVESKYPQYNQEIRKVHELVEKCSRNANTTLAISPFEH